LGYGLGLIGTIMSLLYVVKTVVSATGSYLILPSALKNTIVWLMFITISWFISSIFLASVIVLPALIAILLGTELAINSCEELIHDRLESKVRATAMSFVNLLSSLSATLLLWTWGGILH